MRLLNLIQAFALSLLSFVQAHAQSYETALRTVATELAARLEEAQQGSATVSDFTDLQQQPNELGRLLAQELSDQFVNLRTKVALIDRANLAFLMKEHKFTTEGLVNPETGRKLGKLIGIDAVIVGTTTLIGDQVRLSVRAISLESGKIVAARTTTLSLPGQVVGMSNRGVAGGQESVASSAKLADQIRAGSFKLTVSDFAVTSPGAPTASKVSFVLSNNSGIGVGIGLQLGGTSAGPCSREAHVAGLPALTVFDIGALSNQPSAGRKLRWVPAGGKVVGTLDLYSSECNANLFRGLKAVPVSVSAVLATDTEVITLPIAADNVPIRLMGN